MSKAKTKHIISREVAEELAAKMRSSIIIQNSIHLADRRNPPGVDFYNDENQYFSPSENLIHLGIYGPLEIMQVETEEDYISCVEYFYGHENQHVLSTANKPYDNGIKRSMHAIVEYIAAKEGIRKIFRNDRDYEVFVDSELPKHGIHINARVLMSVCSGLMNSVEDGRIERIRSLEFPGFENQRRYFRAIVWNQDNEFKPYADGLNDIDKLNLHMGSILSLATTGLYLKGFVAEYGGTEIMEETKQFMPYIAKGVLATRTRNMADNVVEIAKLLAPYIYAASKMSNAQVAFEEMIKKLIEQILAGGMDSKQMSNTSEREEEVDDGIPNAVFPMSDIVITLDDETYDELMKKMKDKGKGSGGMMVRREHPKEEEKEGKEGSGNGSGESSDKNDGQNSSNGSGNSKNGDKKDDDGNGGGGEKKDSDGKQKPQASQSSDSSQESSNSSDSGSNQTQQEGNQPYEKEYSRHEGGGCENNNESGSHASGGGENGSIEMVLEQMEKAAQECRDSASEMMSTINQSVEHTANTNRGCAKVVANKDKPITKEEMKDICSRGFEETRRKYKLDQPLPPSLNARAKAFRKKNERYFRSLSTPNVTHMDSGCVDPSRIFGLAIGETDVFRKIGQDKKFNGCVYILIDNSGSMGQNKRREACKAAAVIEEGFKGIIPMKIVAFDTCGPVVHEVIKGWDESQKLNCCWNFALHGRSGCGNDDAKDILIAQRELLTRPEEKKLLIVLSDGAPSSIEQTKCAIDETRRKGIPVFGIYFEEGRIGSDANEFQYMYQKDYVCCELNDVDNELTKLMIKFSRS